MSKGKVHDSRTFYWVWFGVFTAVSVIANAWHAGVKTPAYFAALHDGSTHVLWKAWKTAGDLPPAWFTLGAVALGALMPIALAFGSHALANPRPNVNTVRKRVNFALTGATVVGAFILSFLAMQDLAMMLLGLSPWTAAIVPIAVDIAIVSALAELVARSPQLQDTAVERRVTEHVGALNAARQADMERITAQVDANRDSLMEHLDLTREADHDALLERLTAQLMEQVDASRESLQAQLMEQFTAQPVTRPMPREAGTAPRSIARAEPLVLTREPVEVAADLAASGSFTLPAEVIARVLELSVAGLSQRKAADAVTSEMPRGEKVSASTIGRIVTAARELEDASPAALEAAS